MHFLKNVLIVSCVFPPEPVVSAQISKDLANELIRLGFGVTVLAPVPSRPLGYNFPEEVKFPAYCEQNLPNVQIIHVKSAVSPASSFWGRAKESYSFGMAVVSYLKTHHAKYSKVYINSWPLISQYLIARECVRNNLRYIMHIQDIYPESLTNKLPSIFRYPVNNLLMPLEKFHLKHAQKVIAISEGMKSYFIKSRKLSSENISVVYNWQDDEEFKADFGDAPSSNKFTFMYLGNIGPVAGVDTLIRSFCKANVRDCRLIIAGNGVDKAACIELAAKSPDADILFIDVLYGNVAKAQNQADVLLLPVIKGGALSSIPSKLPGYMLSKKPILATLDRESDTAKAILAAGCGWVGDAEDEAWLTEQIETVSLIKKEELPSLGMNGYDYCMANFSKRVNLAKLLKELLIHGSRYGNKTLKGV